MIQNEVHEEKGIRKILARSPAIAIGLAVVLVGAATWYSWSSMQTPGQQIYVTTDDGATTFRVSNMKVAPFESGGKEAVQAVMVSCDGGKSLVVGHLARYGDAKVREQVAGMLRKNASGRFPLPDVKRPGEKEWVSWVDPQTVKSPMLAMRMKEMNARYEAVKAKKCPDGTVALIYDN
jgi:hypothetical protein